MKSMVKLAFTAAFFWGICVVAFADDLNPPPWRGTLGSTFQHWGFNTPPSPNGQLPDSGSLQNPPLGASPLFYLGNAEWLPAWEGRNGVVCLGPNTPIHFLIPNIEMPPPRYKEVWIQVTWWSATPTTNVTYPGGPGNTGTVGPTQPLGGGWNHTTVTVALDRCPPMLDVSLLNLTTAPIYLDQVVVDTRCVPEPASMTALGMGLAVLLRRKRK